jgi:hypothetical protein
MSSSVVRLQENVACWLDCCLNYRGCNGPTIASVVFQATTTCTGGKYLVGHPIAVMSRTWSSLELQKIPVASRLLQVPVLGSPHPRGLDQA